MKSVANNIRAKKREGEQGFTLLEVIIAMCILTIGILAVASMQLSAIRGNSSAIGLTEAVDIGQEKLEELIQLPLTDPQLADTNGDMGAGLILPTAAQVIAGGNAVLASGGANQPDFNNGGNPVVVGGKDYFLYWNASPGASGTANIGVVVAWRGQGIMHRTILHYIKFR